MIAWALKKILGTTNERELKKIRPLVDEINKLEAGIKKLSDADLKAKTPYFREKLDAGASLNDILVESFAVCREASARTLRLRHYDVQLIGGMALHNGMIAEMRTGEGKTLVATLACYLNGLEGKGVHVVTVNDYLARRDSEQMGKLYNWLGLTTGVVVNSQEEAEKRAAYQADITYGQNNEFGFDYLRDNMKTSALEYVQRELNFGIIDEADSILIDEARTPLIISGQPEASSQKYKTINEIIPKLRKDEHYVVDEKMHQVTMTDDGIDAAQRLIRVKNLFDPVNLESLHILNQCLRAHSLFKRDVNYLVTEDGKVMIIDEFTGRVLAGRRWSDGLHQAVEAKEQVRVQEESRTMATITFQNLFRLYKKLGGMTGTAETEATEFHGTYKLNCLVIPTNKPILRRDDHDVVYKTEKEKFTAVIAELLEYNGRGQPVLVGTTNVEKSLAIAKMLKKAKIEHAVLNAKQHEKEAYVIAQAGRKGAITVSTNMAGRGTDIILGGNAEMLAKLEFKEANRDPDAEPEEFQKVVERYEADCKKERGEVVEAGGLHILGTERHESRRIDNQLRGRAGRQGDPGSSRFYLSLEDDLMRIFAGDRVKGLMDSMGMPDDEPIEHPWVSKSISDAQTKVEARNFDIRKNVLEYDDVMNQQRRTVYRIRQQLLLGIYKPEILDDEGKPTGALRTIKPLERLEGETKAAVLQIVLFHAASPPTGAEAVAAPTTLADCVEIHDSEAFFGDIYKTWGYRFEAKDKELKSVSKLHDRLLTELVQSLTEQRERLLDVIDGILGAIVEESCKSTVPPEDWDWAGIRTAFLEHFKSEPTNFEHVHDALELTQVLYAQAEALVLARETEMGTELLLRVFRFYYMREIDQQWVEHLTSMEQLRDGIGLRGYGQRDPKQEYKKEGYDLFVTMMASTSSAAVTQIFGVKLQRENSISELERADMELAHARQRMLITNDADDEEAQAAAQARAYVPAKPPVAHEDECPCGSGLAFSKCHGKPDDAVGAQSDSAASGSESGDDSSGASSGDRMQADSGAGPLKADEPCICGSGEAFKDCHGKPADVVSA
jgi:preprotein translocase subunit SecA